MQMIGRDDDTSFPYCRANSAVYLALLSTKITMTIENVIHECNRCKNQVGNKRTCLEDGRMYTDKYPVSVLISRVPDETLGLELAHTIYKRTYRLGRWYNANPQLTTDYERSPRSREELKRCPSPVKAQTLAYERMATLLNPRHVCNADYLLISLYYRFIRKTKWEDWNRVSRKT